MSGEDQHLATLYQRFPVNLARGKGARVWDKSGKTNAGTIYDSTNYHFVVPSEGFPRALEIMAAGRPTTIAAAA